MREMKDSGVEWIGEIPEDWNVGKTLYALSMPITDGPHETPELFDEGIPFISAEAVSCGNGHIDFEHIRGFISQEFYEECCKKYIPQINDIYMIKSGATTGKVAKVETQKLFTIWSPLAVFRVEPQRCYYEYLYYFIQSDAYQKQIENKWTYGTQQNIGMRTLEKLMICFPSITQQKLIADYLDSKCSKIDEIIEKQQAIIEKLKEYKISIITEVVTKGLDYEVDYKESGTEWLGKIPSHWQYLSFKNVLKERNEKNFPVKTAERLSLSIDKGVTLYSEKTTNLDRFKDDVSQYKLAHEGDFVLNSMNMIVGAVGISHYFGCVSPAYYTYYDNEEDHITAKYCDYLFHSKTVKKVLHSLGKGIMSIDRGDDRINTCRLKVSRTDLRALKIPVPPICEQREIVKYLQSKENLIDKTIADRNKAIDKFQEYKKSLIYEVVTGKKEV
jgi:type I restriction enzyme S subunit